MGLFNNKKSAIKKPKVTDIPDDAEDKRSYYRLPDSIHLDYRIIEDASTIEDPYDPRFKVPYYFQINSELFRLEVESSQLLHAIGENNRQVGQYLKIMNKRINCLSKGVCAAINDEDLKPNTRVILSEGGISFKSNTPMKEGTCLHLKMVLFPDIFGIAAVAKVTSCEEREKQGGKNYTVGAEFTTLLDSDQQVIAKHIIQEQSRAIRATKEP